MKKISFLTQKHSPEQKLSLDERRSLDRRDFSYYMQLVNHDTQELVGHLSDIGTGGFKLDSLSPIPINKDFQFRMEQTREVASKPSMVFLARSRWCKVDPLNPFCYNVGFQLVNYLSRRYGNHQLHDRKICNKTRRQACRHAPNQYDVIHSCRFLC